MEFLLLITIITGGNGISTEQIRYTSYTAERKCLEAKREVESKSTKSMIIGSLEVVYKAECIKLY